MSDARAAATFAEAGAQKQQLLSQIWPDLHAILNRHVNDSRVPPVCAVAGHPPPGPEACGRITLNGTPACGEHGGTFPLDLIDPRTWSEPS